MRRDSVLPWRRLSTEEARFKGAIVWLWRQGRYPGPTLLNLTVHSRASDSINGRESKWRTEEMQRLGIPLQRPNASPAARRQHCGRLVRQAEGLPECPSVLRQVRRILCVPEGRSIVEYARKRMQERYSL